ncbi:MAG: ATP-binding protein [Candidatus Staskawiczbacteria bacterium]|nr:ATP-binding protein [Candidatus Staskawiczbacteria bacterium]
MAEYILIAIVFFVAVLITVAAVSFFTYSRNKKFRQDLAKREEDTKRKMYEISILKELGDRIGYSLNVQNIIDIITGSLHQFIDYSAASYMLIEPEEIIFKVHLEKSVSEAFVNDIKNRMANSLSALLNKDFSKTHVEEILSGALLVEDIEEPVRSFFNIPLVIAGKVVGVLTIAGTKTGLYKEEEMTILYKITQQASQAVTRLQQVVETEQAKLNAMVSSMTEGVVMTDPEHRILVVNPAAKKAIGIELEKDISISDFIDKLSGKFDFRGKIEESVKLDKVFISDEILLEGRFFQVVVSPVKNRVSQQDSILGCVTIFRDITEEKEAEKMKEDFTSMIVHELRTPLDGIKKIVESMRKSKIQKAKQPQYLQMMYHSSSDMLELINNLLDVAKIEAGKFQIFKQPSNIREIIESRVLFFQTAAKDAKIKLVGEISENVPEKVDFDQHTISQVLNNLISNALKFSKENGKIIIQAMLHKKGQDIKTEASAAKMEWFLNSAGVDFAKIPDSLLVAVTDNGVGISSADIGQLFIKFSQLKNMFTQTGGTGLGLAITKSIVESHGGIAGVESTEGQGSTFYFTLPMVQ